MKEKAKKFVLEKRTKFINAINRLINTNIAQHEKKYGFKFRKWGHPRSYEIPSAQELGNAVLNIRGTDCSNTDLSKYNPENILFDSNTKFPKKLPLNFNPIKIMESHKNPGLNIHKLHERGIDGTGMAMAIIDSGLAPHSEFIDNVVFYEEFGIKDHHSGEQHGCAVASIAVGKTCGVAPNAKLYYMGASGISDGNCTAEHHIKAMERIIEINKKLPTDQKISIVSISLAPMDIFAKGKPDQEKAWKNILVRAKEEGIFVNTCDNDPHTYKEDIYNCGLNVGINGNPDKIETYQGRSYRGRTIDKIIQENPKQTILWPQDHRTIASPYGYDKYVHYANGGNSWMMPYESAVYILAKQVNPTITPEMFFDIVLNTGEYNEKMGGIVANPESIIKQCEKDFMIIKNNHQQLNSLQK